MEGVANGEPIMINGKNDRVLKEGRKNHTKRSSALQWSREEKNNPTLALSVKQGGGGSVLSAERP